MAIANQGWHPTTLNQVLAGVAEALLTGWENPESLMVLSSECQRLQSILTKLLSGKELLWYFSEAHDGEQPSEIEWEFAENYTVYSSWTLGLPLFNVIDICKSRNIIALSLCGCSGASALTEYIKIKGGE